MEDSRKPVINNFSMHRIGHRKDQSFISQGTERERNVQYLGSDGVWYRWARDICWFLSEEKAKEALEKAGLGQYC